MTQIIEVLLNFKQVFFKMFLVFYLILSISTYLNIFLFNEFKNVV